MKNIVMGLLAIAFCCSGAYADSIIVTCGSKPDAKPPKFQFISENVNPQNGRREQWTLREEGRDNKKVSRAKSITVGNDIVGYSISQAQKSTDRTSVLYEITGLGNCDEERPVGQVQKYVRGGLSGRTLPQGKPIVGCLCSLD